MIPWIRACAACMHLHCWWLGVVPSQPRPMSPRRASSSHQRLASVEPSHISQVTPGAFYCVYGRPRACACLLLWPVVPVGSGSTQGSQSQLTGLLGRARTTAGPSWQARLSVSQPVRRPHTMKRGPHLSVPFQFFHVSKRVSEEVENSRYPFLPFI